MLETYNKTVNIEGQLMLLMANRYILPAAFRYQKELGESVVAVDAAGGESPEGKNALDALTGLTEEFKQRTDGAGHRAGSRGQRMRRSPRQALPRRGRAGDGAAPRNRRRARAS